jgi:hypothetical protein
MVELRANRALPEALPTLPLERNAAEDEGHQASTQPLPMWYGTETDV